MDYEIVNISDKIVVGLSKETTNSEGQSVKDIGYLWKTFMGKGIYNAVKGKKDGKTIGLYTDYQGDFTNPYNFIACCEVSDNDAKEINLSQFNEEDIDGEIVVSKVIPGGKYAKFVIVGDIQKSVGEFWVEFWKMSLDRTYIADFEEYQNNVYDMNKQEIHIYIGIK